MGEVIPEGGLVCFHCGIPPICEERCPAQMFYIYPIPSIPSINRDTLKFMSILAIHVGSYVHPPHSFVPREAMIAAEMAIRDQQNLNLTTTPSRLKLDAT